MKTTVIDRVQEKDPPPEWAACAHVEPYEKVEITIQPPRSKQLKELLSIMDCAGEEAEKKGLTDKKLEELLKSND